MLEGLRVISRWDLRWEKRSECNGGAQVSPRYNIYIIIFELWFEENSDERIERAQNKKKKKKYRERVKRKVWDKRVRVCV